MAPTLQKLGHKPESLSVIDVQVPLFEDIAIGVAYSLIQRRRGRRR